MYISFGIARQARRLIAGSEKKVGRGNRAVIDTYKFSIADATVKGVQSHRAASIVGHLNIGKRHSVTMSRLKRRCGISVWPEALIEEW